MVFRSQGYLRAIGGRKFLVFAYYKKSICGRLYWGLQGSRCREGEPTMCKISCQGSPIWKPEKQAEDVDCPVKETGAFARRHTVIFDKVATG
jgi:hypothetical protein